MNLLLIYHLLKRRQDKNIMQKPLFTRDYKSPPEPTHNIKLGDLRLVPKGSVVSSCSNQMNFVLTQDVIVQVIHLLMEDFAYVKPQDLCGAVIGAIPYVLRKGSDEWSIRLSETEPYEIPKSFFPKARYESENKENPKNDSPKSKEVIPCGGYRTWEGDFDCEYGSPWCCEECVCNGGTKNPLEDYWD